MVDADSNHRPLLGERISIIGNSCSGKSTLAARFAELIDCQYIELDALFWLPDWQESSTPDFRAKVTTAIDVAPRWAVSGNYFGHEIPEITWSRADTIIWLDLPLRTTLPRLVQRSWQRWQSHELLWGTNQERFWAQWKLWDPRDSLVAYTLRSHRRRRLRNASKLAEPEWAHLRKYRLRSPRAVASFLGRAEREAAAAPSSEAARG